MLGFLAPIFFGLLIAAPAIIFAYRRKLHGNKKIVPSLFIFKQIELKSSKAKRKIKFPLRLILELCFLSLIALAATKPYLKNGENTIAIVIDNSRSMAAGSRLQSAIAQAKDEIKNSSLLGKKYLIFSLSNNKNENSSLLVQPYSSIDEIKIDNKTNSVANQLLLINNSNKIDKIILYTDLKPNQVQNFNADNIQVDTRFISDRFENYFLYKQGDQIFASFSGQGAIPLIASYQSLQNLSEVIKREILVKNGENIPLELPSIKNYKITLTSKSQSDELRNALKDDDSINLSNKDKNLRKIALIDSSSEGSLYNLNKIPGFDVERVNLETKDILNILEGYDLIITHLSDFNLEINKPVISILPTGDTSWFTIKGIKDKPQITSWNFKDASTRYLNFALLNPEKSLLLDAKAGASSILYSETGSLLLHYGSNKIASGFELLPYEGAESRTLSILLLNIINKAIGTDFNFQEDISESKTFDLFSFVPPTILKNTTIAESHSSFLPYLLLAISLIIILIELIAFLKGLLITAPKAIIKKHSLFTVVAITILLSSIFSPKIKHESLSSGIVALVDLSASIPSEALDIFKSDIEKLSKKIPIKVFAFGEKLRELGSFSSTDTKTDFEQAFIEISDQNSRNNFSSSSAEVLLYSDGIETKGSAKEFLQKNSAFPFKINPILINQNLFKSSKAEISMLQAPLTVRTEDPLLIKFSVHNHGQASKKLEALIFKEDTNIQTLKFELNSETEKLLQFQSPKLSNGLNKLTVVLKEQNSEIDRESAYITVQEKEKALILSGSEEDSIILKKLFASSGYLVEQYLGDNVKNIKGFEGYGIIAVANLHSSNFPSRLQEELKFHTEKGKKVLLIGGEKSFGLGGYIDSTLEKLSPAKFIPPQTKKKTLNNAVMLLIDKSKSMLEDNRIEAARRAALISVNSLKDQDYVGVIGFDSVPFEVLPLDLVQINKTLAERRLSNLTAAGATEILDSLKKARLKLSNAQAGRKHIIILSDGQFPSRGLEYLQEINNLKNNGITVSAIAIGLDADVPTLKTLANQGSGQFYQTNSPSKLPEIFLQDIKVAVGEETMKEEEDYNIIDHPQGLRFTTIRDFPKLRGFVKTELKIGAELGLSTQGLSTTGEDIPYPIFANWKFGEGSVAIFTSDLNGRWSLPWLRWEGFLPFWKGYIEGLKVVKEKDQEIPKFDLRYFVNGEDITFDLAIFDEKLLQQKNAAVTAKISTQQINKLAREVDSAEEMVFVQEKPGRFTGTISYDKFKAISDLFISINYNQTEFPQLGIFLNNAKIGEIKGQGINYSFLNDIAKITGGEINPDYNKLQQNLTKKVEYRDYFSELLILAMLILIFGIFYREKYIN